MKWRTDNPPVTGKYIVETKSTFKGSIKRLESSWNGKSWNFSNQLFYRWLDEEITETIIVCIPVEPYTNARKVCEAIESRAFDDYKELRTHLDKELGVDYEDEDNPIFFSLTDFMDECNDQYFNAESYFISYVKIIKK
jgi:hypothetical protein